MTQVLPASPNWYCNSVISCTDDGVIAYGSRGDVTILQLKNSREIASISLHHSKESRANKQSVDKQGLPAPQSIKLDAGAELDPNNSLHTENDDDQPELAFQASCSRAATQFDDCTLLTILTRAHRERTTAVRLKKCEVVDGYESNHREYSMFTGSDDGRVRHYKLSWAVEERNQSSAVKSVLSAEHELPRNCKVTCLELCSAEQMLIGDDKANVTTWNWKTGITNVCKLINSSVPVYTMSFNSSKKLMAIGMKNGGVFIYDVTTYQVISKLKGHDDEIHTVQWRPDSVPESITGDVISASRDKTIRMWDMNTRRCISTGKLPTNTGAGYNKPKGQDRERVWLSVTWLPTGHVISSSQSGDLLVWDFSGGGKPQWSPLSTDGPRGHYRIVFTILSFCGGTKLITTSMDRNLILWDIQAEMLTAAESVKQEAVEVKAKKSDGDRSEIELEEHFASDDLDGLWKRSDKPASSVQPAEPVVRRTCSGKVVFNISTLGGFSYCIRPSPVDPGRLAVAVGDNLIRVWNVNEGAGAYDMYNLWQGLKSKVSSVAWHPFNEGQLAYGTDDGRVGYFPSVSKKPPVVCGTYHQKMVYVISWGPQILSEAPANSQNMTLYSVGDGTVLIHNLAKAASEPARDLNALLREANGPTLPPKIRSEIAWSHDFSLMFLGNEDGSVLVIRRTDLRCVCSIKVSNKLVNAVRLSPSTSNFQLIAIASNEHTVKIVEISSINPKLEAESFEALPVISDAVIALKGHKSRVTDICWSHHNTDHLISVSYDCKAIVWNVSSGTILSEYKRHHGKLLTCMWSLLDADLVYTGSDDFTLRCWRPSLNKKIAATKSESQNNGAKSDKSATGEKKQEDNLEATVAGSAPNMDMDEISRLLEEKKRQLLAGGDNASKDNVATKPAATAAVEDKDTALTGGTANILAAAKAKTTAKNKKKAANRAMFPNMTIANRQTPEEEIDELVYLHKQIRDGLPVVEAGKEHLGIYSTNNEKDFSSFIEKEKSTLMSTDQVENAAFLCICQGNVEEALQNAVTKNCLSDSLVNAASMLGYSEWMKYCRLYAQQLRTEGSIHQAVTYLLYTHDVDTALLWLSEENHYREAICLARSRFPPGHEKITSLYQSWSKQLRKDANIKTAARCFVGLNDPKSTLDMMVKQADAKSPFKAIRFALSSPDCREDLLLLCDKLTRQSLISQDYVTIEELCKPHTILHPFLAWSLVLQSLVTILETGATSLFSDGGLVGYVKSLLSSHGVELKNCRKQCSLSQQYVSASQARIAICERLLNLCVDVEEGITPQDKNIVDVYSMIMMLQTKPLIHDSAVQTANLIQLLTIPGCDVITRLRDCSFEPSHCLEDYSLHICYIWSALILSLNQSLPASTSSNINANNSVSQSSNTNSVDAAGGSIAADVELTLENLQIDGETKPSDDPRLADDEPLTSGEHKSQVVNGQSSVTSPDQTTEDQAYNELMDLVSKHMYQVAFSLCNGLFLPWLDSAMMKAFRDHLNTQEKETGSESFTELDVMELVSSGDHKKSDSISDLKNTKCILAMLLDIIRHLFVYMCGHDDSGHLPNLTPGRQLIREWVVLHAECHEVGVSEDLHVSSKKAMQTLQQVGGQAVTSDTGINSINGTAVDQRKENLI